MAFAQKKEQLHTIDYIFNLPEGVRAELIDGDIYDMSSPSTKHQRILSYLHGTIFQYIRSKGGHCEVFPAPFAVFLNKDDRNYLEPDISVICDKNKLDNKGCNGSPDWVIEIVSQSTASKDYVLKTHKYQAAGVREYWIVDPRLERITTHYFESDEYAPMYYNFTEKVKVNIYDDLTIDFNEYTLTF